MRIGWLIILLSGLIAQGCKQEPPAKEAPVAVPFHLQLPPGFPEMPVPEGNELTTDRVALGKRLFFDTRLSSDFSLSCASCHVPARAFSGEDAIAIGVGGAAGLRNSPTLANVGYQQALFAEGGVPTLELQAIAPIVEAHEMNLSFAELIDRLYADEDYPDMFLKAYNEPISALVITKALAAFQRTLISGNSRFDQYHYQGITNALNESEIRGMNLFFSDSLSCGSCHSGFLFTNQGFENIGLPDYSEDEGLARLTDNPEDIGRFKVPTLRNIAVTAPYMHNGSLATLNEVIDHFVSGGSGHPNQSELIKPIGLSEQEKSDLVNFLNALTDETFINDEQFQ